MLFEICTEVIFPRNPFLLKLLINTSFEMLRNAELHTFFPDNVCGEKFSHFPNILENYKADPEYARKIKCFQAPAFFLQKML